MRKFFMCIFCSFVMSCFAFAQSNDEAVSLMSSADEKQASEVAEEASAVISSSQKDTRPDPYKNISWEQVNQERDKKDDSVLSRIFTYFVHDKEEVSYNGDKVKTVAVTTIGDDDAETDVTIIPVVKD